MEKQRFFVFVFFASLLGVSGSGAVEKALAVHRDYVMAETLATDWAIAQSDSLFSIERDLGDERWLIEISKNKNPA